MTLINRSFVVLIAVVGCESTETIQQRQAVSGGVVDGVANVRSFGAVGDARLVSDARTVALADFLDSASAQFSDRDVGKMIWCVGQEEILKNVLDTTVITHVISSTRIRTARPANDSSNHSKCVWGTQDDSAAFVAAFQAVEAPSGTMYPLVGTFHGGAGTVVIPAGGYIISKRIYNKQDNGQVPAPSLLGAGQQSSILFLTPDMEIPSDGTAMLIQATGPGAKFGNFGVDALNVLYEGGTDIVRFINLSKFVVENLEVNFVGSTDGTAAAINFAHSSYGAVRRMFVQYSPARSRMIGCKFTTAMGMTVETSWCSNMAQNLVIADSLDRSPSTLPFVWEGGGSDECGLPELGCTSLLNAEMNVFGATFFGGNEVTGAIALDRTSRLWLSNANVGMFNNTVPGIGLTIAEGGKVTSVNSTLRGNGTSVAVDNRGTFVDGGGNEFKNCVGFECTPATDAQAFSRDPN